MFSFKAEKDVSGNIVRVEQVDTSKCSNSYYDFQQNLMIKCLKQEVLMISEDQIQSNQKDSLNSRGGFKYTLPDGT